ncbi:hypothetical protein BJY04DRAFT_223818 [Aspergillus karnatakaensis]|uniref:uncharacterized protein n=1 Tax=Aspergillus karnatakaensis TaxID=1810916 RepID=UPI003CCCFC0C
MAQHVPVSPSLILLERAIPSEPAPSGDSPFQTLPIPPLVGISPSCYLPEENWTWLESEDSDNHSNNTDSADNIGLRANAANCERPLNSLADKPISPNLSNGASGKVASGHQACRRTPTIGYTHQPSGARHRQTFYTLIHHKELIILNVQTIISARSNGSYSQSWLQYQKRKDNRAQE